MKVTKTLNTLRVDLIIGTVSRELAENCPDLRNTFPSDPCTNHGCPYIIREPEYMNCTFVASEAGEHTLDQVGRMIGVTREGARLIEKRGLMKVLLALEEREQDYADTLCEPDASTRSSYVDSEADVSEPQDENHSLRVVDGRKLAQC